MPKLPTDLLTPNQVLKCGDYLTSRGNQYYAAVLPDGQFCIYAGDSPGTCRGLSWSSNAVGQLKNGTYALIMQSDGNLCVYESYSGPGHGALIWQSQTAGGTSFAAMQDDGNFCIYRGDGQTNTGFRWGTIQNGAKTSSFGPLQPVPPTIAPPILPAKVWHRIGAGAAIPDMPAAGSCKIDSVDILLSNSGDTSRPNQGKCFIDVFSKRDDGLFSLRGSSLLNGLNFSNTSSVQRLVPSSELSLQQGDFVGLRVEGGFIHVQWTDGGNHKMWWDTDRVTGKPGRYVGMVSCGWVVNVRADIIGDFKAKLWSGGWYDPTKDTYTWANFKATFLTNAAVATNNPAGIINACNNFINTDPGSPDRGMWDTMTHRMRGFVSKWKDLVAANKMVDKLNEFGADFLDCFKIPNRAAHNGDLWESVFNAANQTKEKYVPTKISGDGGMEVRLHNLGGFNTAFSVRWSGGASEVSQRVSGNYGTIKIKLTPQMLTPGTPCWVRAHIQGGPDHNSGRNFDYRPGSFVEYTVRGTTLNPSFD